ncbi:hypothetical protein [Pyruvatibacter sp.]|uniref:hypothetical protein n=1 Tax=Pyruvatibacter sp. TaxID=1981328 RepID=UPI003267CDF6
MSRLTETLTAGNVKIALLAGAVCFALAVGGQGLAGHVASALDIPGLARDGLALPILLAILLVYVALLACPFVPGAEVGLMLLVFFGADLAGPVYLATVAALCLSFFVGRQIPDSTAAAVRRRVGLAHAAEALVAYGGDPQASGSRSRVGWRIGLSHWVARAMAFRGLTLAVLINTPGNVVFGGGGGIALTVGLGRLMPFRQFVVSVALAVAPVPLFFILMDSISR